MPTKTTDFRHNHYVPEWYQRRFLTGGNTRFHYLDLAPEAVTNGAQSWRLKALRRLGPDRCFAQDDLYTTSWGAITNVDIEKFFFGQIDREGLPSVEFLTNFRFGDVDAEAVNQLLRYMSVQKLRTPKGLAWFRQFNAGDRDLTLQRLQQFSQIFCATWSDCVWSIADASRSPVKFIVSDHPVTVYNRDCFPGSSACQAPNDPDIRLVGTQTIFPLSADKVLLLSNLAWVRNPYQSATKMGPNEALFRPTMFSFLDIQFDRFLSEEEVTEINYIIKKRAFKYIAAGEREWLFPEHHLRSDHWRKLGDGYLLMPDPRHVYMGGTTYVGYKDGHSEGFGPYGHRPWQPGFEDERRDRIESKALRKFQAEFSAMQGPEFRGISSHFGDASRTSRADEFHEYELGRDREERKKPGERRRRRQLLR